VHGRGKVLLDGALAVALGGDCLADAAMLRAESEVFGTVASDPTISRLIGAVAATGPKALIAIRSARSEVRPTVWELARTSLLGMTPSRLVALVTTFTETSAAALPG
jgi:hypothetical protein